MAMERVVFLGCFRNNSIPFLVLRHRRAAAEELKRQSDRAERESRLRQEAEAVRQQLEDQRLREQRAHKGELSALRNQVCFTRRPAYTLPSLPTCRPGFRPLLPTLRTVTQNGCFGVNASGSARRWTFECRFVWGPGV